jgi:HIRAN domain
LFGSAGSTASKSAATTADAQKALVAAILELRAVVDSGTAEQISAAIDVLKAKAAAGDLEPRELAGEVAKAEHMLTVLAYTDRLNRGEGVQAMAVMPDGEPAYFRATNVSRETARDDDYGQLDIGEKGIFYDGEKRLTIVWGKVLTIGIDRELLIVHPTGGGTPHTFGVRNQREAQLAHVVASAIFKQQAATATPAARRKRPAPPAVTPPDERSLVALDIGSAAGVCNFNIVGESHYQGRLRNICTSGRSFTAVLMPEPTNAVDPNAIRVVAEGADTIGYLSKEDAVYYAPVFALLSQHNRVGTCRAQLTGGVGEKRSFGVLLNLRDRDELLIFIRDTLAPGTAVAGDVQPF